MQTGYKSSSSSRDMFIYIQRLVPNKASFQIHREKIGNSVNGFEPTRHLSWKNDSVIYIPFSKINPDGSKIYTWNKQQVHNLLPFVKEDCAYAHTYHIHTYRYTELEIKFRK